MFRDSLLNWRRLFVGILSGRSESAGGPGGRETFIFRGLETCFVSGKECCPEYCCGVVGSMCEGLLVLGLCVRWVNLRCALCQRRFD